MSFSLTVETSAWEEMQRRQLWH